MEVYGKLQGTYRVKNTIVKIEKVSAQLSIGYAAEIVITFQKLRPRTGGTEHCGRQAYQGGVEGPIWRPQGCKIPAQKPAENYYSWI